MPDHGPRHRQPSDRPDGHDEHDEHRRPIDYDLVTAELERASAFDLYRLRAVIDRLLEDPARLAAIKRQLRPDQPISYFDERENRLVQARLLEVRKTRALVRDLATGKTWTVPLYMLNLEGRDTEIAPRRAGVDRLTLRIGDRVGFTSRAGQELFGSVVKLNPKRAKIRTGAGIWSVPYGMLSPVIDAERGEDVLIGELVTDDARA